MVGGDVSIYSLQFDVSGFEGEGDFVLDRLVTSPLTDLKHFHPELFTEGFLTPPGEPMGFEPGIHEKLLELTDVVAVYTHYRLPVRLEIAGNRIAEGSLRGRDTAMDASMHTHPSELIRSGRWFQPEDNGELVCLLPFHPSWASAETPVPAVGDYIRVRYPNVLVTGSRYAFNVVDYSVVELRVIGHIEASSRFLNWEAGGMHHIEYLYWTIDEVFIPASTWIQLWEDNTGGTSYEPQQLSLVIENTSFVEDVVVSLRMAFPGVTVVSTFDQLNRASSTMRLETRPLRAPAHTYYSIPVSSPSLGVQADLRLPITIALMMTAALVIASNLLIIAYERKKEIAVLKAVGCLRKHICCVVLCEAVAIATIGGFMGVLFVRIQVLLNQVFSGVGIITVLYTLALELTIVIACTWVVSILFGMLPAVKMVSVPVMELMRDG